MKANKRIFGDPFCKHNLIKRIQKIPQGLRIDIPFQVTMRLTLGLYVLLSLMQTFTIGLPAWGWNNRGFKRRLMRSQQERESNSLPALRCVMREISS